MSSKQNEPKSQPPSPKPVPFSLSAPSFSLTPFAEPTLTSTLYGPTHHALRAYARAYIDTHILSHHLEWEALGTAPPSARAAWLCTGLASTEIPSTYRPTSIPILPPDLPSSFAAASLASLPSVAETTPATLTPPSLAQSFPSSSSSSPIKLDDLASLHLTLSPEAFDPLHTLLLNDECSRIEGGVGVSLGGASVIGVPPLLAAGTSAQKARWLPGLFDGTTSFCLGVTEPSGGSDVANVKTTARKSADRKWYVLNGVKKWITGAPWARYMTTVVRTGLEGSGAKGVSLLVVDLEAEGVEVRRIEGTGQKAGGASWVEMTDVRVPVENLVGEEGKGFRILMRSFNKERYILAVGCNRKVRTCLKIMFEYAHQRETFGKKLVEHGVIRRKMAEVGMRVEAHWAWLEQVAVMVRESPRGWESEGIGAKCALLKVMGAQLLELANREAMQVLGGKAYQRGEGEGAVVEQIGRDLRMMVVGGGSEEIVEDLAVRQEVMMARKRGWKL